MARQDVNFGFTSTGADGLARDFKKVGDTATLAAKGARVAADALRASEAGGKAAADGMRKAERAANLLDIAEHELNAELDKTNTKLLEQLGAAEVAGKGLKKAGRDAKDAGGGFSGLAGLGGIPGGGMGAAIAAGVALAPVLVTVGTGLAGLGAAAYKTVSPILAAGTATKAAREALAGLDPAQRAAYDSLGKLKTQFAGFGKALEPTVLDLFNKGLRVASGLMADIAPVAKAVGTALGGVLDAIDKEFRSGTWQQFFKFMADTAGTDVRLLGQNFTDLMQTLPPLLTALQPVAEELLTLTDNAVKAAGAILAFGQHNDAVSKATGTNTGIVGFFAKALANVNSFFKDGGVLAGAFSSVMGNVADSTGKAGAAAAAAAPLTQQMAANLFVEKTGAAAAASAVTDLNSAWSAFLGMSTGLENAQLGIIGVMKTLTGQADKAGASFRGTNDQSVALQTTFESSLIPSVENVIGSMRTAHASTHDLATVIATDLKPAVDKGALSNTAYKNQLYDLAVQAGYTGPNKLAPLKAWFDRNASSTDAAKAAVDRYAAALAKIPGTVHTTIIAEASGTGQIAITGSGWALGQGNIRFHAAAGAFIRAGTGPTADDVPAMLSRGELVVPARMVQAGAVDHLRGLVPGFAAGGLAGVGGQVSAAPGQAGTITGNLAGQAIHTGVSQALAKAHAQVAERAAAQSQVGFAPGPPASGSALAAQNYAKSILWAYGWGPNQFPPLLSLWNQESGWNANAVNPSSGAYGIPQALGHGHPYNLGDYANQVRWGLAYISGRYGSPAAAWAHEQANNWYASGGLVGKEGAAYLRAWQDRHGGGYGAAWGPEVINRQLDTASAALTRNTTLAHASLPPAQHRHYVGAAAWWKRHRDALVHERGILRDWRGQLYGSDHAIGTWIAAAGSNRALAPSVRRWKTQRAHQEREIASISRALGWSAAQQAAIDKARPKPPPRPPRQSPFAAWSLLPGPSTATRAGAFSFDSGGILPPGISLAVNNTGRGEMVTPAGGAAGGGGNLTVNLNISGPVGSQRELETWLGAAVDKLARQGRLGYAFRRSGSAA